MSAPGGKLEPTDQTVGSESKGSKAQSSAAPQRAKESKLQAYFESAPQAILAVSQNGTIQLVNRRTEEIFGYDRAELLGRSLSILIPARYRQAHGGHISEYFQQPRMRSMGTVGMSLAGVRKDGTEFPVEVGLSHVMTEEGAFGLALVTDITERKRAESELARLNSELVRSNAELSQFAYVASHDLQEPLRIISGYLQLLEKRYGTTLDTEAREFIAYAVNGAARLKELIQDLLRLSRARTQEISLRRVQASTLMERACANLRASIEETGAGISSGPLPTIDADPVLLTQVFQNLIANGIKFRKKGERPIIAISADREGDRWIFSIRDNGIGIESQHFDRIFQIFERLHGVEEYSGSGVGLAISQRIVERHGGKIWVQSTPGEWSIFYFSIPCRD